MAETYTNGVWIVKVGEEDAFVAAWTEFASWDTRGPAPGRFGSCATCPNRTAT